MSRILIGSGRSQVRDWATNRTCVYEATFWDDLARIGISAKEFDELSPSIDESIRGASLEKLDEVYPPLFGELRLILTEEFRALPRLRIAFEVDQKGDVLFRWVDRR